MANPTTIGQNVPVGGASSTTVSFATNRIVTAGEKVWVIVSWFDTTSSLNTVTGGGLAFTVDSQQSNDGDKLALAWADCAADVASGTTIQGTLSANGISACICGMAASGWATGAALARNAATNGQTWSSGSVTVASGNILVGGAYGDGASGNPPYNTPSGGNTEVHDFGVNADSGVFTEFQVGTGAAIAISGTVGATGPSTIAALAASFAASGATPAGRLWVPRRMPLGV